MQGPGIGKWKEWSLVNSGTVSGGEVGRKGGAQAGVALEVVVVRSVEGRGALTCILNLTDFLVCGEWTTGGQGGS